MNKLDNAVNERLVTPEMLQNLPEPVQHYMAYTGVVGKPWINTVHLQQTGRFRLGVDRPWMPMTAKQWYTTNPPAFTWNARFRIAGLPIVRAQDKYEDGQGHMFGKIAGLFTVFDIRGEKLDQGTMLRYLNEMMWFPIALLGENIFWEGVDDHSAKATFTDGGKSVTAHMFFGETGRLTNFTAMRYREAGGEFSLDPWSTPITRYGVYAGLNLPICGTGMWNLPSGDLEYVNLKITRLEYNTRI